MRFEVSANGFKHQIVKREGSICLVKRWKQNIPFHWEVVRLRYFEETVMPDGTIVPAGERYPKTREWGIDGFTYLANDANGADQRYRHALSDSPVLNTGAFYGSAIPT
jgi:hypothetical protein